MHYYAKFDKCIFSVYNIKCQDFPKAIFAGIFRPNFILLKAAFGGGKGDIFCEKICFDFSILLLTACQKTLEPVMDGNVLRAKSSNDLLVESLVNAPADNGRSGEGVPTLSESEYLKRDISSGGITVHIDADIKVPKITGDIRTYSAGKYSLGMKQRLGIAQAIMENQQLLILDEPMNALDKDAVEEMRKLFLSFKASGKTMLIVSHNEGDISTLCDEVYEFDGARIKRRENV